MTYCPDATVDAAVRAACASGALVDARDARLHLGGEQTILADTTTRHGARVRIVRADHVTGRAAAGALDAQRS